MTSADLTKEDESRHEDQAAALHLDGRRRRYTKYAFPISGKGLWSIIYGYLALEQDLATIVGRHLLRARRNPGLGGEVDADWFQDQFEGKKI